MKQKAICRGGSWGVKGSAQGEVGVEEKSSLCFGPRLQTQIEIPPHVQPVVLIHEKHSSVSAATSPSDRSFSAFQPVCL